MKKKKTWGVRKRHGRWFSLNSKGEPMDDFFKKEHAELDVAVYQAWEEDMLNGRNNDHNNHRVDIWEAMLAIMRKRGLNP